MTIYGLYFETGSYSYDDYINKPLAFFSTQRKSDLIAEELNKILKDNGFDKQAPDDVFKDGNYNKRYELSIKVSKLINKTIDKYFMLKMELYIDTVTLSNFSVVEWEVSE